MQRNKKRFQVYMNNTKTAIRAPDRW